MDIIDNGDEKDIKDKDNGIKDDENHVGDVNNDLEKKKKVQILIDDDDDDDDEDDEKSSFKLRKKKKILSIKECIRILSKDTSKTQLEIEEFQKTLDRLRKNIVDTSRDNFLLEKKCAELSQKIKLLVTFNTEDVKNDDSLKNADSKNPLGTKKAIYEKLFYYLQSEPRYFALMARHLSGTEIHDFVKTVVFDMYGDQYDTREERLLLSLFKMSLKDELEHTQHKGSLFRANTANTKMLSAYARRGQGLFILKKILEEPLINILDDSKLIMEIKPMQVYFQLINDYETKQGKRDHGMSRNKSSEEICKMPQVMKIVEERVVILKEKADEIFRRIVAGVELLPFGIRWICKKLGELYMIRFPQATKNEWGSIIGGYIYLRFFNPIVVTPDALHFVERTINKVQRRNLVLVAKLLQNLSNGVKFGKKGKEPYMAALNQFIDERSATLTSYFEKLVDVDELDEALHVDKYVQHTGEENVIRVSYNQIILIHQLLERLIDSIAPDHSDPVRKILKALGKAKKQVPHNENRVVSLTLGKNVHTLDDIKNWDQANLETNPLYRRSRFLFLVAFKKLSMDGLFAEQKGEQEDVITWLEAERDRENCSEESKKHINNLLSMMDRLKEMKLLREGKTYNETVNDYVRAIAEDSLDLEGLATRLKKRIKLVEQAKSTIQDHHNILSGRLKIFETYLENVREGSAQPLKETNKVKKKKERKKNRKATFTHDQLVTEGILLTVDPNIPPKLLKRCYYAFYEEHKGVFAVDLHLKRPFDIKLQAAASRIKLEELLQKQQNNERTLKFQYVTLNVNLLIHLLTEHFPK